MSNPSPPSESSYADAGSPPPQISPRSDDDSSSDSPLVLYRQPTLTGLLRTAAINLVLPFINGLMLGFGELFAHEIAFRLGWGGTRVCVVHPVCFDEESAGGWRSGLRAGMGVEDWEMGDEVFPLHRTSRPVGPGIEVREQRRRRTFEDQLADLTSLE
ncbi:hypothetical protein Q9L58_004899 [Maublancomyces gigas]|uniref:Mitochondrial import protein 1 n=1 Tax=Discina gigas TaxID=1032678 RepID=A0ABR3GJL0_9PEZI